MKNACSGFTLVEMLVAIAIMALLAGFTWRALDAMLATRDAVTEHDRVLERASLALEQWDTDLASLQKTGIVPSFSYDGNVLRLTRVVADPGQLDPGLQVVAWALASGQWRRWASPAVSTVAGLRQAWQQAANVDDGAALVPAPLAMAPATQWRVLFHRDGAWRMPAPHTGQGNGVTNDQRNDPPEGVRLEIALVGAPLSASWVRRDWARITSPFGALW